MSCLLSNQIQNNPILLKPEEKILCNICFETYDVNEFINMSCNHKFCKTCLNNLLEHSIKNKEFHHLNGSFIKTFI